MYRKYPNLTLILATSPIVALALGLMDIGPAVYEAVATRLLSGGWSAVGVLIAHVGPLTALVVYRSYVHVAKRQTGQTQPNVKRPAVDSGPFGRLIE